MLACVAGTVSVYCLLLMAAIPAWADEQAPETDDGLWLKVSAPYLDVHTGPGSGYPIDQVVTQGDYFQVMRRRTDWLQIQFQRGLRRAELSGGPIHKGWISAYSLARVENLAGDPVVWSRLGEDAYYDRLWEIGVGTGDLNGGAVLSINAARYLTRQLSIEVDMGQSLGNFSENNWMAVRLVHHAYPRWSVTPFLGVGFGAFYTKPKATLAETEDRVDDFWQVAVGVKAHVWRSFLFRVDYQHNAVLTSRANNEFVSLWRAGVGYFF